jgi:hypothetical protein
MQTSIEMIIEEVKILSNLYENKIPSVLLFETLFKAEEMHKEEIVKAFDEGQEYEYQYHINNAPKFDSETYYEETFKKD